MYKEFEQEANDCADLTIIELALFSQTCTLNSQTNRSKFCDAYLFARFAQVMQVLASMPIATSDTEFVNEVSYGMDDLLSRSRGTHRVMGVRHPQDINKQEDMIPFSLLADDSPEEAQWITKIMTSMGAANLLIAQYKFAVLADAPNEGKSLRNYPSAREKEVILRNFTRVRRHHPMADVLN
jgi:hypothetical protein